MSKNTNDLKLNLITDASISDSKHDSLDFKVYAEVITEAIITTPTPFTVGVFGDAGKGKTSLMKFIQNEIIEQKTEEKIISVFFNAWKFEKDEHPLLDLCSAIEKDIQKRRTDFDEDIIANILDYVKYLKYAVANIKVQAEIHDSNDIINNNIDKDLEKQLLNQSTYFQIFELLKGLEKVLNSEKFRIIIFIDDLDKCLPKNAIKLLESINLVLNLKGLSFVLGIDRDTIESFLEQRYNNEFNLKNQGKNYLDKMIQLPFYLPSYSGKIDNFINNLYPDSENGIKLEKDIKDVILSISSLEIMTPRFIVRLINRIKVNSKIYLKLNPKTSLTRERVFSLFSISCTLEELYNEIYSALVNNDTVIKYIIKVIQNEAYINEDTDISLNINKTKKDLILQTLEENYKVFRMIFSTEQGKFWLEHRAHRLNTFEFLKSNSITNDIFTENIIPFYKTNFEDNAILLEDQIIDEKEFIKIPNQNFEMSKYVITNKWFKEFINNNGYKESKYWIEIASKIWLMNNRINSLDEKYETMIQKEANYYRKKYDQELLKENFNKDLQPIVYVTYYEAQAFCKYLSDIDKEYKYEIPTKEQWDYVASAGEKREYPWGNKWNKDYCNNSSNQFHRTSEIGMFKQGDSKFGISDLVGNVWVWTSSLEKNDYNYLKGGSWNFADPSYFKVSDNQLTFFNNPSFQSYDIGFFCIRIKL